MADNSKPFFLSSNEGFGNCVPADDFLHPAANAGQTGDTLTETQYLGFNIPEKNIHGVGYIWHHPNLKVVTGGVWVFQGIKPHMLASEIVDIRAYMSDRVLQDDLHAYRLDNGYGVEVIEPMKQLRLTYADASRGNEVDITFTGIAPPVMFGSGMHFEQGMKTTGKIVLGGEVHEVNGFTIRDRSWGQLRPEESFHLPPMNWMTGVFDEDFMFNCTAFDHPDADPEWGGAFTLPAEAVLKGGWIYKNGQVREVKSVYKKTVHDPATLHPSRIEMTLTDSDGVSYAIKGEVTAGAAWQAWPNFTFPVCLTRWTCEGQVGWGDTQEAQWPDFVRAYYDKKK